MNLYICSMEIKLTQKQKELIEKFGVFSERSGMSPVRARIVALLLVCDNAELTFDEIYHTLMISKSAASNAINSLLLTEKIEYYTKPGDRKRYFRIGNGFLEQDFEKILIRFLGVNELLREILVNRTKSTKAFNTRLQNVISFMDFLQNELSEVNKKWKKRNK